MSCGVSPQVQIVSLLGYGCAPKLLRMFFGQLKSDRVIELGGSSQRADRPEKNQRVILRPTKPDGVFDQLSAQPVTAQVWMQQEPAQLRHFWRGFNNRYRSGNLGLLFDDPNLFPRAGCFGKLSQRPGDVRLERMIPSIFCGVEDAVQIGQIADVARSEIVPDAD